MSNRPLHIPSGTSPIFAFGEHQFRFLATSEDTGGSYSAMEIVSPQESGPGPHTHDDAEEHFLVLEGEVDFHVGQQAFLVKAGDFIHVPRGVIHQFTVRAPHAKMIATYTPAGEEQGFIDAATPLSTPPRT